MVATTGVGFRGWLEAADAWDLPLVEHLLSARVLARGPKARGAIRGGGLVDAWSPESESSAEVLEHLLSGAEGPLEGRRIAVQLHGDPLPDLVTGLRAAGAEVLTVPVYRWVLPEDVAPVHRLVAAVIAGGIDAVTFTSAPAAASLLAVAEEHGRRDDAGRGAARPRDGGRGRPGDRRPARRRRASRRSSPNGPASGRWPARSSPGCPSATRCCSVGAHTLQVRGHGAVLDGRLVELAPGPMAVLRALARRPGHVVPRAELIASLPGGGRRARRRDGRGPAARRARRARRRDGGQARLPPQASAGRAASARAGSR